MSVSCGEKHTLCVSVCGAVWSWGEGEHGRLGTGHTSSLRRPAALSFLGAITMRKVVAAREYSFGLSLDGLVLYGWGRNDRGQMGQGGGLAMDMYSCDTIPVAVDISATATQVLDIGLSAAGVLAVDASGAVFYWGERVYLEPHQVNEERLAALQEKEKVRAVDITAAVMCFVTDQGRLLTCNKTFGMKSDIFALGHGSVAPFKEARPVEALGGEFVTKVVANDQRVVAIAK